MRPERTCVGSAKRDEAPPNRSPTSGFRAHRWALADAVRKLGHWEAYVRRHRVVLVSVITKMAQIPEVLKYEIADFVCPPGGN